MFLDVSDPLQVGLTADLKLNLSIDFNPVKGLIKSFFMSEKNEKHEDVRVPKM